MTAGLPTLKERSTPPGSEPNGALPSSNRVTEGAPSRETCEQRGPGVWQDDSRPGARLAQQLSVPQLGLSLQPMCIYREGERAGFGRIAQIRQFQNSTEHNS